jgi:hypothetical protein
MTIHDIIMKSVNQTCFQRLLEACYGGSIGRFIRAYDFDRPLEEVLEEFEGEDKLREFIRESVFEDLRDLEKEEERQRQEQEFWERYDRIQTIYEQQVVPLLDTALRFIEGKPGYDVHQTSSSTYIYGGNGTIRFSDHPQAVQYLPDGTPVPVGGMIRGGWCAGDRHPAADLSVDPSTVEKLSWVDVRRALDDIAAGCESA